MINEDTRQLLIGICEAFALELKRRSEAAYEGGCPIYGEELDHNRDGVLECIERLIGKSCGVCKHFRVELPASPCSDCEHGTSNNDRFERE